MGRRANTNNSTSHAGDEAAINELKQIVKAQENVIHDLLNEIRTLKENQSAFETARKIMQNDLYLCDNEVVTLKKEINELKGTIILLESQVLLSDNVTDTLKRSIDDTNQYSRRNCLILNGINADVKDNLKEHVKDLISQDLKLEVAAEDIDRVHRIGPVSDDKNQSTIVKFKSFTERTNVYKARGKTRNAKIHLNLTSGRSNLLKYAQNSTEDFPIVDFVFADINCQLKIRLKEKVCGKIVHAFFSEQELAMILGQLEYHMYMELLNV